MSMVYDIDVKSLDDPYIHTAEEAGDAISEITVAGAFLVDIIPLRELDRRASIILHIILTSSPVRYVPEWFPGAGFQKRARQWRITVKRLRDAPYDDTMKRLVSPRRSLSRRPLTHFPQLAGDLDDCVAKYVIESVGKSLDAKDPGYAEYIVRSTLASLYIGRYQHDIHECCEIHQQFLQVARTRPFRSWDRSFWP